MGVFFPSKFSLFWSELGQRDYRGIWHVRGQSSHSSGALQTWALLSDMTSSSYSSRSRKCWSVTCQIDGITAWNFLWGSAPQYSAPCYPYPHTNSHYLNHQTFTWHAKAPNAAVRTCFDCCCHPVDAILTELRFPPLNIIKIITLKKDLAGRFLASLQEAGTSLTCTSTKTDDRRNAVWNIVVICSLYAYWSL